MKNIKKNGIIPNFQNYSKKKNNKFIIKFTTNKPVNINLLHEKIKKKNSIHFPNFIFQSNIDINKKTLSRTISVIKSPHVHKKSMEQFKLISYSYSITLQSNYSLSKLLTIYILIYKNLLTEFNPIINFEINS